MKNSKAGKIKLTNEFACYPETMWTMEENLPDVLVNSIFSKLAPASCGSIIAGMCISRSVSSGSQTIL